MTLDNKYRDFLFIHYKYKDFIIDRNQFSRSVSFGCLETISLGQKYLTEVIGYGKERILNFDLEGFLFETFKVEEDSQTKLCIISNIEQLSDKTIELLEPLFRKCNNDVSKDAISFSISSKSEIKKYNLEEFKSLSKTYKDLFKEKGILSCFFNQERIQYFIDIDKFLYQSILEAGKN